MSYSLNLVGEDGTIFAAGDLDVSSFSLSLLVFGNAY